MTIDQLTHQIGTALNGNFHVVIIWGHQHVFSVWNTFPSLIVAALAIFGTFELIEKIWKFLIKPEASA